MQKTTLTTHSHTDSKDKGPNDEPHKEKPSDYPLPFIGTVNCPSCTTNPYIRIETFTTKRQKKKRPIVRNTQTNDQSNATHKLTCQSVIIVFIIFIFMIHDYLVDEPQRLKSIVFEISSQQAIGQGVFEKSSFNKLPSIVISLILPSLTE